MVCVPCIFIPMFLIIWRFIIQPCLVKLWRIRNLAKGNITEEYPEMTRECKNGTCTLSWKNNKNTVEKED